MSSEFRHEESRRWRHKSEQRRPTQRETPSLQLSVPSGRRLTPHGDFLSTFKWREVLKPPLKTPRTLPHRDRKAALTH